MFDIPGGFKLTTDKGNVMVFRNIAGQVKWNTDQIKELLDNPNEVPKAYPTEEGYCLEVNSEGKWRKSAVVIELDRVLKGQLAQIGNDTDPDEGTLYYRYYAIADQFHDIYN